MRNEIRILVVDDNEPKRDRVIEYLSQRIVEHRCNFSVASNYAEALQALKSSVFDLVLLDLMLPVRFGAPSTEHSRTLMEQMIEGELFPVPFVIGLTEFHNAAETEQAFYAAHLFSLEVFSWENADWADKIAARITYLARAKLALGQYNSNNFDFDLLILTTRYENEFLPITDTIKWESDPVKFSPYFPNAHYRGGRLVFDNDKSLRAGVICIGEMGSASAAALTTQAILVFRPRLIAMLGVCCGFKLPKSSTQSYLGDVLVARESSSWEAGKYVEAENGQTFLNRASVRTVDARIRTSVANSVESASATILPEFKEFLATPEFVQLKDTQKSRMRKHPEIQCGMIVSGSSVVADAQLISEIISRHPTAVGLDMEIFGVYTAAGLAPGRMPAAIGVKGVADHGDGSKNDDVQAVASKLSYFVFKGILKQITADGSLKRL